MSNLTAEQVRELTERINGRLAEFNTESAPIFDQVSAGVVRLVHDVIEEMWDVDGVSVEVEIDPERHIDDDAYMGIWNAGYQRGREAMRAELGMLEKAGGWVGQEPETILMSDFGGATLRVPSPPTDPDQIRADIRDHTAYPSLDNAPNGKDVFAGVHPVAGVTEAEPLPLPEPMPLPEPVTFPAGPLGDYPPGDDPSYQATPVSRIKLREPVTHGNGHTELSPDATATLGPEHTVVTPIVPRRPRTLAEADADARAERTRAKDVTRDELITELQRQAMAGTMPTQPAFDLAKPATWPMSQMLLKTLDTTWAELAEAAGLRQKRR